MRCMAGKIMRHFGNNDILVLVELKSLLKNLMQPRFELSKFCSCAICRFLYPRIWINRKQNSRDDPKYGSFTGSVISKVKNVMMMLMKRSASLANLP